MSSAWTPQMVAELGSLLFASKNSFHASFCLLMYDHIITLDQEINRIWSQQWNAHKVLFLLNRYISPTQFLIQLLTLDLPAFSGEHCKPIYRLPYASAIYSTAVAEVILILRTYALWGLSKRILLFLSLLWLGHVTIMILATVKAHRYDMPPGFVGCTLTAQGLTNVFFWSSPWIADTIIFSLTLWKTFSMRKSVRKSGVRTPLLTILARDGIIYYSVIVGIDTVNLAIFLFAAQKIKPMGAAFCQMLMTVMISRLQLNLRAPCITHGRFDSSTTQDYSDEKQRLRCRCLQKICACVANGNVHAAGDQGTLSNGHGVEPGGLSTMRSLSVSVMLTPSNHDGRWDGEVSPASSTSTSNSTVDEKYAKISSEVIDKGRSQGKGKNKGKGRESRTKIPDEAPVLPALTLTSVSPQSPHWWFDRQVLSLGGVCEDEGCEEEDEEPLHALPQYYSSHSPSHIRPSEFSPSSPSSSSTQPHLSPSSSHTYALAGSPSPILSDLFSPSSTRTSSHTILNTTSTSLTPPLPTSSRGTSSQRTPPSLTSTSPSISIPIAGGSCFRRVEEHELGEFSPRGGRSI